MREHSTPRGDDASRTARVLAPDQVAVARGLRALDRLVVAHRAHLPVVDADDPVVAGALDEKVGPLAPGALEPFPSLEVRRGRVVDPRLAGTLLALDVGDDARVPAQFEHGG